MNCDVHELRRLADIDRKWIAERLTKAGSDFQRKLGFQNAPDDGAIAIVRDFGEIVGWARSERWINPADGVAWQTLEAFVAEAHRRRGIATYAAAALVASAAVRRDEGIAVFQRSMLLLAKKSWLLPVLFEFDGNRWLRA